MTEASPGQPPGRPPGETPPTFSDVAWAIADSFRFEKERREDEFLEREREWHETEEEVLGSGR